jgi:hypothetical protein
LTVVSGKVPYTEGTAISSQRHHGKTEGNRAEFETMGEGADIYKGAGEGAKGCSTENGQVAEEKDGKEEDGENEGVGKESSLRMFYRYGLLRTRP